MWLFLLVFSLILIVIGIQGNLGVLTAIVFCPQYVLIGSEVKNGSF
jgi:hypothetical protein